jgi:radical SAM protein with 4Fe4S-binding SPASM domain
MNENIVIAKRVESKDLREQNRQPLNEIIPIPVPFVMYIDPTNLCNFRCKFCPTADKDLLKQVGRPSGLMHMDLFKKIVDELKLFDEKLKLISMYKDGEPLVNKKLPEMVQYLKDANVTERIWTKTNGALLNPNLNQRLIDAGLDMINISVEQVNADGYMKIAEAKIDYEAFRNNIQDLYNRRGNCKIYIKIADAHLTAEEIKKFYADFENMSDYISVEKLMGWSYSSVKDFTLGTHPDTYDGLPLVPKEVCAYPFYVMAINFDGTVSLCGNDWSHGTVVGDVNTQTLQEIWNGDRLFEFRKMMLEGRRRENRACGDCYYLQIVPDNIDAHRLTILKNLEDSHRKATS